MNFFDILFAEKHGEALSISHFDALFAKYIAPAAEIWGKYDGTLPAQYTANGDYLADYRIYGAAEGVGDRTENLSPLCAEWSLGQLNAYGVFVPPAANEHPMTSDYISVTANETYTFYMQDGFPSIGGGFWRCVCFYDSNKDFISPRNAGYVNEPLTCIAPANAAYARLSCRTYETGLPIFNVGSVALTSYVPYGYEVDMSVRSANLIDVAQTNYGTDYYAGGLHWEISGQSVTLSETLNTAYTLSRLLDPEGNALQLTAGKTYYAKLFVENAPAGSNIYIFLQKKVAETWSVAYTINANGVVIIAPTDVEEWAWQLVVQGLGITYNNTRIRIEVSESPIIEYVPYSKTVTPVYIGSDPLEADEYVDYGAGKIYRMSGGTLTPTDPPVPLLALPTVDGTTIVDYAGQSTAPSRFYAKYKKG